MEARRLPVPPGELETTWNGIRHELRCAVTDLTFHLWLDPLELAARERDVLYVRSPRHIRTLVEERYLPVLRAAAERSLATPVAVSVVGEDWSPPSARAPAQGREAHVLRARGAEILNPKYTFEQFVIGEGNRLAHAAALAVAEQPGQVYNPLFLHGPPGLGKTHLLQAIGNYVQQYGGGLAVRYATADEFTGAFVRALRGGGVDEFKAAFRDVDVLLLDDVHFLADRARTQEEFFHTFNALYETGCQLAVSSDRAPGNLAAIERRLAERFGSGLVAELEAPDLRVRLAILRKRAALDELSNLSDETLDEIAREATTSVRALEGALIRVIAYASLVGEDPTPQLVRRLLRRLYAPLPAHACGVPEIQAAAANAFGVSPEELIAHDRRPRVVLARQIAMYLARELTSQSLPAIGAAFGGRNHSTVLHAHRKVGHNLDRDSESRQMVDELLRTLRPSNHDRAE